MTRIWNCSYGAVFRPIIILNGGKIVNSSFYKIDEVSQHKYYQVPKELYINSKYKTTINNDAKVLYAFLLDRMELSRINQWVDDDGTIFLIFKREDLADMLGICTTTIWRAFRQLKEVGLIDEKRQGLGKPNLIYIGKIELENNIAEKQEVFSVSSESENINVQIFSNSNSGVLNSKCQDLEKIKNNKTKENITDNIKTEIIDTENVNIIAEEKNINNIDSS